MLDLEAWEARERAQGDGRALKEQLAATRVALARSEEELRRSTKELAHVVGCSGERASYGFNGASRYSCKLLNARRLEGKCFVTLSRTSELVVPVQVSCVAGCVCSFTLTQSLIHDPGPPVSSAETDQVEAALLESPELARAGYSGAARLARRPPRGGQADGEAAAAVHHGERFRREACGGGGTRGGEKCRPRVCPRHSGGGLCCTLPHPATSHVKRTSLRCSRVREKILTLSNGIKCQGRSGECVTRGAISVYSGSGAAGAEACKGEGAAQKSGRGAGGAERERNGGGAERKRAGVGKVRAFGCVLLHPVACYA